MEAKPDFSESFIGIIKALLAQQIIVTLYREAKFEVLRNVQIR